MSDEWSEASSSSSDTSSLGSLILKQPGLGIGAIDDSDDGDDEEPHTVVAVGWESWSDSDSDQDGFNSMAGAPSTTSSKVDGLWCKPDSNIQGSSCGHVAAPAALRNHSVLLVQKMECAVRHDIESAQHSQHSALLSAWRLASHSPPPSSSQPTTMSASTVNGRQDVAHQHSQRVVEQVVRMQQKEEQWMGIHICEGQGRQGVAEEERQQRLALWKLEWHQRERLPSSAGKAPYGSSLPAFKNLNCLPRTQEWRATHHVQRMGLVVEEERVRRVAVEEEIAVRARMWRDWRVQGMEVEHQLHAARVADLRKEACERSQSPAVHSPDSGQPTAYSPGAGWRLRNAEQRMVLASVESVHRELAAREEATSFAMLRLKWSNVWHQHLSCAGPTPSLPTEMGPASASIPTRSVSGSATSSEALAQQQSADVASREEERLGLRHEQFLRQVERLLSSEVDFRHHVLRSEAGQFTTLLTNAALHYRSVERMERDRATRAERQARVEQVAVERRKSYGGDAVPCAVHIGTQAANESKHTSSSTSTSSNACDVPRADCSPTSLAAAGPTQLVTAADYRDEGNRLHRAGQYTQAILMYTKAIALLPNSSLLHANRASSYLMCERYNECIADCDCSIVLDATNYKAFSRRGRCHQMLGHLPEAVRDFERVFQLEGGVQARQQLEDAREELRKVLHRQTQGLQDHYMLLEIPNDAGEGAIRKAYKKACLRWHPDKWSTGSEAEQAHAVEMFKRVAEAQDVLLDPHKRLRYDADLAWGRFNTGQHVTGIHTASSFPSTRTYYRPSCQGRR
eukprot:GGOE01044602.1.p1 GENE.GGOE01044602.1~~GGOE01044602.1.p1  ORF type:complete len:798 (+),score=129.59 GGOE01044602.1:31-2424(+)